MQKISNSADSVFDVGFRPSTQPTDAYGTIYQTYVIVTKTLVKIVVLTPKHYQAPMSVSRRGFPIGSRIRQKPELILFLTQVVNSFYRPRARFTLKIERPV